jgi:hypothetical protein
MSLGSSAARSRTDYFYRPSSPVDAKALPLGAPQSVHLGSHRAEGATSQVQLSHSSALPD